MKRIAIVGGGIAGLSAAYDLERARQGGAPLEWRLFESTARFGGIVETVRSHEFVLECGPDGWVSEKRAARELAMELGLGDELVPSRDEIRQTYLLLDGQLRPMPQGLRMMVPTDLSAIEASPLFSADAKAAFRSEPARAAELRAAAPADDESIASFIQRHFGEEVLTRIGAPLLSGVFGGDVGTLSVRAVMAPFVALEREFGSLITALERRPPSREPLFTSLRSGLGTLVDRMVSTLPADRLFREAPIEAISSTRDHWELQSRHLPAQDTFTHLILATPAHVTRCLISPIAPVAASLLPTQASSAIVVSLAFEHGQFAVPEGFGFLVPPDPERSLLACTFMEQKYPDRVPPGARLLRAFFGASAAERLASSSDSALTELALSELRHVLGPLPDPSFAVLRRWPNSLPQYAVGHLDRMRSLFSLVADEMPGLTLLGNSYLGVGLPDLVRDARAAAQRIVTGSTL